MGKRTAAACRISEGPQIAFILLKIYERPVVLSLSRLLLCQKGAAAAQSSLSPEPHIIERLMCCKCNYKYNLANYLMFLSVSFFDVLEKKHQRPVNYGGLRTQTWIPCPRSSSSFSPVIQLDCSCQTS